MATKIFVNLPVKDLNRSITFFKQLGFTFNPHFTDEKATCMIISEDIFVMLLVEPYFKGFSKKEICDTSKSVEMLIALSQESKEKVDELVDKAFSAGAVKYQEADDKGFMYTRTFADPDGHQWEIFWMDPTAIPQPETADAAQ